MPRKWPRTSARSSPRSRPTTTGLGDDCDFLTLALDYPYRYEGKGVTARPGPAAVDDLLGRHLGVPNPDFVRVRWAFNGRLLGDEVRAVYEAMSALFLRPDHATLINAYGEGGGPPFGPFSLKPAAETLEGLMEVNRLNRPEADLSGWQSAFGTINRSGLVMINSSGNPSDFRIGGKVQARTWDVPLTSPAVVSMIHSFSAANPNEPGTIAGRWLANGAYVYFGSVHEPYVQSFRTPELLADLLDAGVPFGASVRMLPEESPPFGNCWRLAYLGDPLFRIDPEGPPERVASWPPVTDWPSYESPPEPSSDAGPFDVLSWAIKLNIDLSRRGEPPSAAMADRLQQIDPGALDGVLREYRDLLLADALTRLDRLGDLRDDLGGRPPDAIGPSARRWLEASQVIGIQRALEADDWEAAASIWSGLARSSPPSRTAQDGDGPPPAGWDRRPSVGDAGLAWSERRSRRSPRGHSSTRSGRNSIGRLTGTSGGASIRQGGAEGAITAESRSRKEILAPRLCDSA